MSKYFDKKAQELDQHPIMREIALKFFNTLSTHIPLSPEYRMLDYGCGSGSGEIGVRVKLKIFPPL